MLKSFLLFMAVVLLVLPAASAPARQPQETSSGSGCQERAQPPIVMAKAKKLYELDCALCHGANGDGKTDLGKDMQLTMLDWTDPKSLSGMSDQAFLTRFARVRARCLPRMMRAPRTTKSQGLVTYIRKFAKDNLQEPHRPQ